MEITPKLFWQNKQNIVLFGLSRHRHTVSHSVFNLLQSKGYRLFPVNPNVTEIGKITCFQHLDQISAPLDAAVIITNPSISIGIVPACAERNINHLWFQLNTMNARVRSLCIEKGIEYFYDCVLHHSDAL